MHVQWKVMGDFEFDRAGFLFGPDWSSLFLLNQELLDCQYYFSFSVAYWVFLVIWKNFPLDHNRDLAIGFLESFKFFCWNYQ